MCPGIVGTTLWKAGERRHDTFGGAQPSSEQVGAVMQHLGMPMEAVTAATLRGLKDGEFIIVTHPHAVEFAHMAVVISGEVLGQDAEIALDTLYL